MTFSEDILRGLTSEPKFLLSKYFYNQEGDRLFNEIMKLDEYYLTRCEFEIIESNRNEFLDLFNHTANGFKLIEFGAGDGYKTKLILDTLVEQKANFQYVPIDISQNVLDILTKDLNSKLPELRVEAINAEYFAALKRLNLEGNSRKIVLFMGGNIGNFRKPQAIDFLKKLSSNLSEDDLVMIGFDLKKDPDIIERAYNDSKGITRDFNINLLQRINDELGGHFDVSKFKHFPTYNPISGEMESFLISTIKQEVKIDALDSTIQFDKWEPIHMEISKKYDLTEIEDLSTTAGFKTRKHFFDSRKYFVDSVWEVV